MKTVTMLDSVNAENLPEGPFWYAGYTDGTWPDYNGYANPHLDILQRFPGHVVVSITVTAEHLADVLDVEKGDATPADVPGWIAKWHQENRPGHPIVYCGKSTWTSVRAECRAHSSPIPGWWAADWTGEAHLVPGSIATQWANGSKSYPGDYPHVDTSLVNSKAFLWYLNVLTTPGVPKPAPPGLPQVPVHPLPATPPPIKISTNDPVTPVQEVTMPKATVSVPSFVTIEKWARKIGSYAAIVEGVANVGGLPPSIRSSLLLIGGLLQSVEHYNAAP